MKNNELINKFVNAWESTCNSFEIDLIEKWKNNTLFTSKILYDRESSVIQNVSKSLDLCYYSECRAGYYGLDAVLYNNKFRIPDTSHETWLRKIENFF